MDNGIHLYPVTFKQAKDFIDRHHSHHRPSLSHKFSIGAVKEGNLVGVIVVGRPVSRMLDTGWLAEATRCCTNGTKNTASKLYAASWRAAKAMGYLTIITYTLIHEEGTSLKAAGWKKVYENSGGSWNAPSRPRKDVNPTDPKVLWTPNPDGLEEGKKRSRIQTNKEKGSLSQQVLFQ